MTDELDGYDDDLMMSAFDDFKNNLTTFLNQPLPNQYVYGDDIITVYTRKGVHLIDNALTSCLDIGTIVIADRYRGQGLGMRVIDHMHRINPFGATFVESLQNTGLYQRLLYEHWRDVPRSTPPSVYKYKSQRSPYERS